MFFCTWYYTQVNFQITAKVYIETLVSRTSKIKYSHPNGVGKAQKP